MLRKAKKISSQGLLASVFSISIAVNVYAADDTATHIKWGYKGNMGPTHWGQLDADFAQCATGKAQSPINIPKKVTKSDQSLVTHYEPAALAIVEDGTTSLLIGQQQIIFSDGHGVQLNFPVDHTKESIEVNNQIYRLIQFHIHSPSETTLHGQSYPLEIHFVHQGDNGQVAVIGVLVKGGEANATMKKMIDHLPNERGTVFEIKDETVNPADLIPSNQSYYSFKGSLTTPPCTEGLLWLVMADPITASPAQILMLRKAMGGDNARPVQPLNGRVISYISGSSL